MPTDVPRLAAEIGKIHVGRDVFFSRLIERILCRLMLLKRPERATGAVGVVVFRSCETVIDEKQHAVRDAA